MAAAAVHEARRACLIMGRSVERPGKKAAGRRIGMVEAILEMGVTRAGRDSCRMMLASAVLGKCLVGLFSPADMPPEIDLWKLYYVDDYHDVRARKRRPCSCPISWWRRARWIVQVFLDMRRSPWPTHADR